MLVKNCMKKALVIDKNSILEKVAKAMSKNEVGSLLILQQGKIAGIITRSDVVKNFGTGKTVFDIMSKKVFTVDESSTLKEAAKMMIDKNVSVLPVTKKGNLVGVIGAKILLTELFESEEFLV